MKWEDPGPRAGGPSQASKYAKAAKELRANPGRWGLLGEFPKPNAAATMIRTGSNESFRPKGAFEAVQRGKKLYARYVGSQPTNVSER